MKFPIDIPPGLFTDDTTFAASGRWADCDNVRFRLGKPQVRGGWESVVTDLLGGVCRSAFPWTDNAATLNVGFGTHATLELYQGGAVYDITPTLAMPAKTLTAPYTVVDASTSVTVDHPGHGLSTGSSVVISGGSYVGRIKPSGTYSVTVVDDDAYTITNGSAADTAATLGSNPLSVVISTTKVTVADTAHKIADGETVTISGATAVGGITPNGTFTATYIDANSYSYNFTSAATSTASGGGSSVVVTVPTTGGGSVTVTPQNAFAAGEIDGTGSTGYGTGGYGVGGYGSPSTADYFPRTWSLGAWGENLIANPRGGTIYGWENDTGVVAAPLSNAPRQVTYALVTPTRQVMALGCSEELSGVFNPLCIRVSDTEDNTNWVTASDNLAEEIILPGGGRIVSGRFLGDYAFVWTNASMFLGTYVGSTTQGWKFTALGRNCGLIGPNAAVIFGQTAFWISPDRQFWTCQLGGVPTPIDCPIREAFADNLAASQGDKIVASSITEFGEVRWDYPDSRDGYENSRYIALQVTGSDAGAWSRGVQARTAMVDAGPSAYPLGVTYGGNVYWHERGQSADGGVMSAYIETADMYLDPAMLMLVRGLWPDIQEQVGGVSITLKGRYKPQGDERSIGPYVMAVSEDKTDLRLKARLVKVKFSASSAPAFFRLGKPIFDAVPAGKR